MAGPSSRSVRAIVIAGVVASAIGGSAVAFAAGDDSTRARITVCADKQSKQLRLVPNRTTRCGGGETLLSWNAKGKRGRAGAAGDSAFDIAASYGFEGTEAEWLESLQGRDGVDGVDGRDGTDGRDRASAYDIAVVNGFAGTEPEWLAALEGQRGPVGPKGDQGIQGEPGPAGTLNASSVYSHSTFVELSEGGWVTVSCNTGDVPLSGTWDMNASVFGAPSRSYPDGDQWHFDFAPGSEVIGDVSVLCLDVTTP